MHTDVSYTDIVTVFEEFVSKMGMQAYGNVLAGVRITESLGNSSVLEIQIHRKSAREHPPKEEGGE
jgi:hypothetical protein